jgi:hypothetical protein
MCKARALLTLLVALLTICQPIAAIANPNEAEYALAARCGKDVAAWFKQEFGITGGGGIVKIEDGSATVGYENHYNRKFNKCIVLQQYDECSGNPNVTLSTRQLTLWDHNDNKSIGFYFATQDLKSYKFNSAGPCNVNETTCGSEEEWRTLAKPYMEE